MADFDLVVAGNLVFADRDRRGRLRGGVRGQDRHRPAAVRRPPRTSMSMRAASGCCRASSTARCMPRARPTRKGIGRASRAAAAGGVTTMVDMPYDDPEPVWHGELAAREDRSRSSAIATSMWRSTAPSPRRTAPSTIAGLIEAGACAFKFSTFEAAPGRFPRIEEDLLHDAFALIAPSGLACGVHNQMQELTRKNIARLDRGARIRAGTPLAARTAARSSIWPPR